MDDHTLIVAEHHGYWLNSFENFSALEESYLHPYSTDPDGEVNLVSHADVRSMRIIEGCWCEKHAYVTSVLIWEACLCDKRADVRSMLMWEAYDAHI